MHIVHIEDFFHPSAGYKYNILSKYMVKMGHNVTIVAPSLKYRNDILTRFFGKDNIEELDKNFTKDYGVNIVRLNVKKYFRSRALYNIHELDNVISRIRPDILSIGIEIVPAYYFLLKYKNNTFPLVLDCHNVKSATTFCLAPFHHLIHRLVFTPIIMKNDIRVIRCVEDNYIEECLGIPINNSPVVSFGSDFDLFKKNDTIKKEFRRINNLNDNDCVCVYIGKLDNSKGGDLLAEAFLERFNTNNKVCLVVVGNNNNENPIDLEKKFASSKNLILRFPTQRYVDMPYYFQIADIALFPKQCSLSFFDAQACGLPVIAEDMDINCDRLSHDNGFIFCKNDVDSFREKIQKFIDMSSNDKKTMSDNSYNYVKKNFNYEDRAKEYISILENEYEKYNKK